jgi:gentisate 1,2-dioxygenase/1-hydroxy-2-naphthoate dioxygenase
MMGIQLVKPGELAWAHRHTLGALRFVIDGSQHLYTVVDGEALLMETSDLILTPNWCWHDHRNEGEKAGIWLDVLDLPLVLTLNQPFYEPLSDEVQRLRPQRPVGGHSLRYPWRTVSEYLWRHAAEQGSPYDGTILEYVNSTTGGSALTTMSCCIQSLQPGLTTKKHRRSASTVYYVVEGDGTTVVGDDELEWSARDSFVVPNWAWHRHVNRSGSSAAVLFSVTDRPLLAALGFYREEPANSFPVRPLPMSPNGVQK